MPSARKTFTAVLEADGTRLRWVVARIPFDIARAWPVRQGRRVRGEIMPEKSKMAGFAFRTSLFPDPRGAGHILLVNKQMQAGADARAGSKVRIALEPDLEERPALMPPELARALQGDRRLRRWFDKMSPSMRREIGKWVSEPKSAETRLKRADQMAERLLLAMEGEEEPPPVLRAEFQRQPKAREAWNALTPTQRRNHLLGIFYYQNAEARARRAAKAVEEALQTARKSASTGK
jgi:uncharacterized protein YdeI (YjbR/CyaY-like superfamily)